MQSALASLKPDTAVHFRHTVEFYHQELQLHESLARLCRAALLCGDSFVLIATPEHRAAMFHLLKTQGWSLERARTQQRLIEMDAQQTLDSFMSEGRIRADEFMKLFTPLLKKAQSSALPPHGRVTVFGEMVALLWRQKQVQATLQLERLWNELAHVTPFTLHCAYAAGEFTEHGEGTAWAGICAEHVSVTHTK